MPHIQCFQCQAQWY